MTRGLRGATRSDDDARRQEACGAGAADVVADVSCAHRQGGAPTGIDANQHGLVRPLARAGIRRLHGMAVRRRSIQVRVTTANARVQGTLDFKSSR